MSVGLRKQVFVDNFYYIFAIARRIRAIDFARPPSIALFYTLKRLPSEIILIWSLMATKRAH